MSVVKEEKPYAEEDVDDGGDEGEVQEQASKVLDAHTSLADQVDKEEAQLEGEGEEHDEQVGKGKELILTFQEAEIGWVVGGHIGQGEDPIGHDVGALPCPCPHLLQSCLRASASRLCPPVFRSPRGTTAGGELDAGHWKKLTNLFTFNSLSR